MYDQSTVISLLREILAENQDINTKLDSLLTFNTALDALISAACIGLLIASFVFVLKGWCRK